MASRRRTSLSAVLEAGAEDVEDDGEIFEVVTETADLVAVRGASASWHRLRLGGAHLPPERDRATRRGRRARIFRLVEALEDSDDVQNVYANYDVTDEVMEKSADGASSRAPTLPSRSVPNRCSDIGRSCNEQEGGTCACSASIPA